jgi:trehalose/maltose hydrolase-like predicted phosphorylase
MAKAPPAKPTAPVAPVVERPNVVEVKHKVTGKVFEVSRKYYETYSQVLDLV